MDFENLCFKTIEIVKATGAFIRAERQSFHSSHVEQKGFNDLVSYVDREAERRLVNELGSLLAGSGFITEENTANTSGTTFQWIIDPLDGTTNFVHGVPCFCISVALMEEERLVMGIIYEINLDECFYAFKNSPAFLNGRIIVTSSEKKLGSSLLATGFPYTNFSRMKPYMQVFDYCMRNTRGLRRLGSAAVDMAYVAAGRFEGFYEYGLNAWDVAAGAFIIERAGGKITDFSGGSNYLFGKEIISTNAFIYDEFLHVVKREFEKE